MYCKICGNLLEENATNCYVCGTPVVIKKTESQDRTLPADETKRSEFSWNVHDFSKPSKPAEPEEFVWDIEAEKFELPKSQPSDRKEEDNGIDKFFTFNQKSEEFQKLLDKEYEKIQQSADERNARSIHQIQVEGDSVLTPQAPELKIPEFQVPELKISEPQVSEPQVADEKTPDVQSSGTVAMDSDKIARMETARREYFEQKNKVEKDSDEDENEENPRRSGWGLGKSIIAFILLIIIIELAMLGIKYFLPNSEAATVIGDFQTNITETVGQIFGSSKGTGTDKPSGNDNPVITTEPGIKPTEAAIKADPAPMVDKAALVSSLSGNNINIKELKANSQLAFNEKTIYNLRDIAKSKPISNNIWSIGADGAAVYYDKAVVGTVIAFDSKWIDFVNDKNMAVLDLTKKDSRAYQNIESFPKSAKIQEEFLLLEIGEVRQTETFFYVWAHESIKVIDNGKMTTKEYRWVYQLEPVAQQMKIVNYCRF